MITAFLIVIGLVAAVKGGFTAPEPDALLNAAAAFIATAAALTGVLLTAGWLKHRGETTASIAPGRRLTLIDRGGSAQHVFVFGMTGSGKTSSVKRILTTLRPPLPALVQPPSAEWTGRGSTAT